MIYVKLEGTLNISFFLASTVCMVRNIVIRRVRAIIHAEGDSHARNINESASIQAGLHP